MSSAEALAQALVDHAIAPDVAAGWAVRSGGRWVIGAGKASASAFRGDPIFDLASLTKPMTALAFTRSTLNRERLLGEVLIEARETASAEVPLELFLAHRAGLEAHLPLFEPLIGGRTVDRSAALRSAASARRPEVVGMLPVDGAPPIYSDLGFLLVGEALARAERAEDAGEVIEEHIARVLGRDDLGTARRLVSAPIDFAERVRPTEVVAWRGGEVRGLVHDENAWALTGHGGSAVSYTHLWSRTICASASCRRCFLRRRRVA